MFRPTMAFLREVVIKQKPQKKTSNETPPQNRFSDMIYIGLQEKDKSSFTASYCSKPKGKKPATHIVISTLKFVAYHSIFRLLQDIICRGALACLSR